jgi:hypothetical protein
MKKEINSKIVLILYLIMFSLFCFLTFFVFGSVFIDLINDLSIIYDVSIFECNKIFCYGIAFVVSVILFCCAIFRLFNFFGNSERFRLKE